MRLFWIILIAACVLLLGYTAHQEKQTVIAYGSNQIEPVGEYWVSEIETSGVGSLELVSNYYLFSRSSGVQVELPKTISANHILNLEYERDGQLTRRPFKIAGIKIRGNLCWIKSGLPDRCNPVSTDTVYVKPCKGIAIR